jgi:uncharacterized protein
MAGIAPKLPLQLDTEDGIALTKTLKETIKQNLKMLVLTSPGERLMIPDYGVGIRNYLFEQNISSVRTDLAAKINEQVATYMPFIQIINIEFENSIDNSEVLIASIKYAIPSSATIQSLDLELDTGAGY